MANDGWYTLSQVADTLGVSQATVRNWIRAGIIKQTSKYEEGIFFYEREIQQLASKIESGKLPYLRSRRNKIASQSISTPTGYLSTNKYDNLVEQILNVAQNIREEQRLELVLLEVYLRLLESKGLINEQHLGPPLVLAWLSGKLELGTYKALVAELYSLIEAPLIEEIKKLGGLSTIEIEYEAGQDLLGFIYMSLSTLGIRKQTGTYYTPAVIVEELVEDSIKYLTKEEPLIIDPCCGSGNFLINLFIFLKSNLLNDGLSTYQAEHKLITKLLTGVDNNILAVILAKMNFSLLLDHAELVNRVKIYCQDTLKHPSNYSYDLIIGNPPWGYKYHYSELKFLSEKYKSATGAVESFNLFFEWAVNHCADYGVIGYVLPEAFLTVKAHAATRRLVAKSGVFKSICRLGHFFPQVNAPVISVIFQKDRTPKEDIVVVKDRDRIYQINSQNTFICEHNYGVFASPLEREIIERINTAPNIRYLKNNADFALGIVTGNNSKHISKNDVPLHEVVIRGKDVYRYKIRPGSSYLLFRPEKFQQVAPEWFYRAPEKLIYRFVSKHLVFAYDDQQLLTLNSANIIIPRLKGVDIKYILAVFNSRILQFYRQVAFPSIKLLRRHLEMLPICCPGQEQQSKVVRLVDKMLVNPRTNDKSVKSIYNEIDQILMDYYQLSAECQLYINNKYQQVNFLL